MFVSRTKQLIKSYNLVFLWNVPVRKGIPNLSALQAFEATARLGSFSRAAEELSLTHSAVHRQVASLEDRLGVALFTRVRRRIALTAQGAEYAARIRQHLDHIEKDTIGLINHTGMGRSIHIAVLPTLAANWLIPRLPDFQRNHPDITVSLSLRTLPFQFNDHPFDGAIYHGDGPWPGTHSTLLFDEKEMVPVCAPFLIQSYKVASGQRALEQKAIEHQALEHQALEQKALGQALLRMQGLTHLHLNSRPDAWRQWYGAVGAAYGSQAAGGPRYELFTMVMAAARAGLGVGLVPRFIAQESIDRGDLVMPVPMPLLVSQGYFFGYSTRNEPSAALSSFGAWLVAAVRRP